MNYFINVDKDFMLDIEAYNEKEKFMTVLFRSMSMNPTGTAMTSLKDILQLMSLGNDAKNKATMKETLTSMEDKGLITIYSDMMKMNEIKADDMKPADTYFIAVSDISEAKTQSGSTDEAKAKTNFKKVTFDEMLKFMKMDERYKPIAFSLYYCITMRIFEGATQRKVSNSAVKTLIEETGFDKKTITKYIKVLKENELIDYKTVREGQDKTKNYYCKWEDKDVLDGEIRALQGYYEEQKQDKAVQGLGA